MRAVIAVAALALLSCQRPTVPASESNAATPQPRPVSPSSTTQVEAPENASPAAVQQDSTFGEPEVLLRVEGMVCQGCAMAAKTCLDAVNGVIDTQVSFEDGTATIRYSTVGLTSDQLVTALQDEDRGAAPAFRVTAVEVLQ